MAKLHRAEMYFLDINDYYRDFEELVEHFDKKTGLMTTKPYNPQTVQFDFRDDHKLNFSTATYEDYRSMFPKDTGILEKCMEAFELALMECPPPQKDCPQDIFVEMLRQFFISGVELTLREVENAKRSV